MKLEFTSVTDILYTINYDDNTIMGLTAADVVRYAYITAPVTQKDGTMIDQQWKYTYINNKLRAKDLVGTTLNQIFLQLPTAPWIFWPPADGNVKNAVDNIDPNKNHLVSAEMQTFKSWFCSQDFKQQLLDLLFANSEFMDIWGQPQRKRFDAVTRVSADWTRTPPRLTNYSWHLDCRSQVAFGMIYFIPGDDPRQSTYFDTVPNTPHQRVPTGLGRGWLVINHHRARHCAVNDTDQYRYCLKFTLNLHIL
jgi:hypothetical protein